MFGLSYYGFTQLYAAVEHPPALKAIFPAMTGY
ncbi:CocE/NonD family hydrolase [Halobacillus amylolyticus]|nr:CocE/NonD family hydrolase [Halobacillus amylolyticus]